MKQETIMKIVPPKTISCPTCTRRMNLAGVGRAAGCMAYFCTTCPDNYRVKELWKGTVVRTGNRGFGFISLTGLLSSNTVHFWSNTYFHVNGTIEASTAPEVGASVLVALSNSESAVRVWEIATVNVLRPSQQNLTKPSNRPAAANQLDRQLGVVMKLNAHDWGFISAYRTGEELFLHRSQWASACALLPGTEVSFVARQTPKGLAACDVVPTNSRKNSR